MTGASRGIGRSVAHVLAEEEVGLVLNSRGGSELEEVATACRGAAIAADLSRPEEVDRLAEAARERCGGAPDILVNNAGTFGLAPAAETSPEEFERSLALNLSAPFRLTRAFLPELVARGDGHLVHIGSAAGRRALPGNVAYSASKFGLRGMHAVLRLELEGTGVRTTLIEPSAVDTGAWDALESRLGKDLPARSAMLAPERVAGAVLFALRAGREGAAAAEVSVARA